MPFRPCPFRGACPSASAPVSARGELARAGRGGGGAELADSIPISSGHLLSMLIETNRQGSMSNDFFGFRNVLLLGLSQKMRVPPALQGDLPPMSEASRDLPCARGRRLSPRPAAPAEEAGTPPPDTAARVETEPSRPHTSAWQTPLGDCRWLVNWGWRIGLRHRRWGDNFLAPIRSRWRVVQYARTACNRGQREWRQRSCNRG